MQVVSHPPSTKSPRNAPAARHPRETVRPTLSVLVVDDVADMREMYKRYFEFRGVRVITAADGLAAFQVVSFERPDVIVLDLAMPQVTGWEVIRQLKANRWSRSIPIIALSGQQAAESALALGADSYVEKPCAPEAMLQEVLRVLREPSKRSGEQ